MKSEFLMGNKIIALAAKDAGAKAMFGYPITPASEILETWASFSKKENLIFSQAEDEMAAGFQTIGACMAGVPAFTATAGPGNVLMQDAFSMAEALRIPTVAAIMQRGGLSTSTVIYSQEEVRLTCFGGNGEGFRIVYSTANIQELYDYTIKAFNSAWKYRFPTFILADGYQGKIKSEVFLNKKINKIPNVSSAFLKTKNLRNCYNLEEEISEIITDYNQDFQKVRKSIEEHQTFKTKDAQIILIAHGIVSEAVKEAVELLRKKGIKAGLFRPITLRPFPSSACKKTIKNAKKIIIIESAMGQLAELFKAELYQINKPLIEINKPAAGFVPSEIYETITKLS
jgi:2-oxoglutarate/2-oxoacid ferredoxin oxidoreductase subunit alpha